MTAAYRESSPTTGKIWMKPLITRLAHAVPACLTKVATFGRTLKGRTVDTPAFFDHPDTNNGPTEAINGHLEHL